ncbi:jerky protein homolog-like [Anastrepha obliqua]|uniref:jerky protein homolog-like n=1 Tax=Anastrepha obliqua TaxID=95512 RepID=UPI00240A66C2|nr:jerky protein homolog-like [Anastrepha obliqua]
MEKALVMWIEDKSQKRIPVDGIAIMQTALRIYKRIKEVEPGTSSQSKQPEFSASTGFLKRHALHNVKIKGETASADELAAKKFPEKLRKIIEDGRYTPDQVWNVDESGLFWKKMPSRTYVAKSQKTAGGLKVAKGRVTLLFCSNASGERMLKPLLNVSKDPDPVIHNNAVFTDITTLAHTIGGDGFDDLSFADIEELLADKSLSENEIIGLTLETHQDREHSDNDEEDPPILNATLIKEGLDLARKLGNHFQQHDPDEERAAKFQFTGKFIKEPRDDNPETISQDDEQNNSSDGSDFLVLRKRMRLLSESDNA